MLYNPEWKNDIHVISLDDFIGWLETKDPSKGYDFAYLSRCAMVQYMRTKGMDAGEGKYMPTCETVFGNERGEQTVLAEEPQTFGALLERAKKWKENH